MLGDTDSILGSVGENARTIQSQDNRKQDLGMQRAQTAMAPGQAAGQATAVGEAEKQLNQVTITPQMAKGLKDITGQSWDQAVGTKWDAKVFVPMTTAMAQAKYHHDILEGKVDIESMKEKAAKDKESAAEQSKKDIEDLKSKHAKELQDLKDKHAAERKGMASDGKAGGKAPPDPITQGRQLMDAINKAEKSGDDATKKAAIENYNKFAKEHGLAEHSDDPDFMEKVGGLLKGLAGGGKSGDDKVGEYMKKNGIKDTPANRKWAESKVNG